MFEVISLNDMKTVTTPESCNHVYVVDVSGSMYRSLELMRQHLKNIISLVATPGDTFSIIYFSGRGQCGVVFENVLVDDTTAVTSMHKAIDQYLRPIGLTGFAEPLQLAMDMVPRLKNSFNNFVMLTDGYDNQSSRSDILEKSTSLKAVFDSASFIEYGWYCDRDLIAKMAEAAGGVHIFAEGYDEYEVLFEETINEAVHESMLDVQVNKKAKHAIYIRGANIVIVEPDENNSVKVPVDVDKVHSIVPSDVLSKHLSEEHLYLILYYAAKTNNSKLVWDSLEALGDVNLISLYSNAFTRQEMSEFESGCKDAVLEPELRYLKGKNTNYVPDKNAFTVLDCLEILAQNNAKLVVSSPLFEYKRTTKASVVEDKESKPTFIPNPNNEVLVTNLTYNSERPNVSLKAEISGTVRLPENPHFTEGTLIPSKQHKNYTIIRDGILNIKTLPVIISSNCIDILLEKGVELTVIDSNYVEIKLDTLPVVNRAMVSNIDAVEFAKKVADASIAEAVQKVINALIKEHIGDIKAGPSQSFIEKYGEEAALWLTDNGIREYGFSPIGTTSIDASDVYPAVTLQTKLKSLSSYPALSKVYDKRENNKSFTLGEKIINEILSFYEADTYDELIEVKSNVVKHRRALLSSLAKDTYALILGKSWFKGVTSDGAYSTDVDLKFANKVIDTTTLTVDIVRKEIKI